MNNILEYNGYSGSIEVSTEDNCLFGKILFISDLVTYEAETITDLKAEFIEAVNDYVLTCKEIGKEPQKPFKGSFNVRVSSELHRKAALEAYKNQLSLNELVSKAIDEYVNKKTNQAIIEHHDHHHYHTEPSTKTYKETVSFMDYGEEKWTISPSIMSNSH